MKEAMAAQHAVLQQQGVLFTSMVARLDDTERQLQEAKRTSLPNSTTRTKVRIFM
jgi:hypothetical protein